ncbi:hypothetical protein [Mycobacterium parascrofulaceum]|uniref:hypothetical protein n=1 Tax=Mycobacterium parascrofulaceum TaxID=240125 RepID=UPI0012F4B8CF|nr:hypothetical protein [Mycobacterium parascrofulaceum]
MTDDLLADVWVAIVRANSPKNSLPQDFDHPLRTTRSIAAKNRRAAELKARQQKRRNARAQGRRR